MTDDASEAVEMSVVDRYVASLARFGEEVRDVQDHEWDLPTPCPDWDVRSVVAHVVLGEAQVAPLVAGESLASGDEVDASIVGTHPMSVWRGTALTAIDAARSPDMVDTMYDHPKGRLLGAHLLGFRICENLVHAHDLSVAVSRPREIDEAQAEWCLDFWLPRVDDLLAMADFGVASEPAADATAADRLLALLGR